MRGSDDRAWIPTGHPESSGVRYVRNNDDTNKFSVRDTLPKTLGEYVQQIDERLKRLENLQAKRP